MAMTDDRGRREAMDRRVRSRIATNVLLVSLLAIVVTIFVNYGAWEWSRDHDVRFDLTRNQTLSLAPATRGFVRSIEDPIEIYLVHGIDEAIRERARKNLNDTGFDSGILQNVYLPFLDQLAADVGAMVAEVLELNQHLVYRSASNDREREEPISWQRRLDLPPSKFLNHVVFYNLRTKTKKAIPLDRFFDLDLGGPDPTLGFRRPLVRGDLIEPNLLQGLRAVVAAERKKTYVVGGHDERALNTAVTFLGLDRFELAPLEAQGDRLVIPDDADLLLVFSPGRAWPEQDLRVLEDWILAGGRALITQGEDCAEPFATLLERGGAAMENRQVGHEVLHSRQGGLYRLYGSDLLRPAHGIPHPATAPTVAEGLPIYLGFSRPYHLTKDYEKDRVRRDVLVRSTPGGVAMPWIFDGRDWRQAPERGTELGDFPLALAFDFRRGDGERHGKLAVFGSDEWLATPRLNQRAEIANLDVLANVAYWLTDSEQMITGTPRSFRGAKVILSDGRDRVFQAIVMGVVPGLILLGGLLVHLMRRR